MSKQTPSMVIYWYYLEKGKQGNLGRATINSSSLQLNERGCDLWDKSLTSLEKAKGDLVVEAEGLPENFETNVQKLYATSISECDCTFFVTTKRHAGTLYFCGSMRSYPFLTSLYFILGITKKLEHR